MRSTTKTHLRYAILLTLLWAYGGTSEGRVLVWMPSATAYCGDSICQSEGCSFGGNETPGDGCLEDGGNCAVDCGYCGDTYCSPEIDEDLESCSVDCGYCGDGVCVHPYESNPSTWCYDDCGTPPGVCDPEECETNADCGSEEGCSPGKCCVPDSPIINPPYCGGACLNNDECCGGDICVADTLGWLPRCLLPGKPSEICQAAPECSTHEQCGGLINGQYCDFSIRTGICRYTGSQDCVPPSGFSAPPT